MSSPKNDKKRLLANSWQSATELNRRVFIPQKNMILLSHSHSQIFLRQLQNQLNNPLLGQQLLRVLPQQFILPLPAKDISNLPSIDNAIIYQDFIVNRIFQQPFYSKPSAQQFASNKSGTQKLHYNCNCKDNIIEDSPIQRNKINKMINSLILDNNQNRKKQIEECDLTSTSSNKQLKQIKVEEEDDDDDDDDDNQFDKALSTPTPKFQQQKKIKKDQNFKNLQKSSRRKVKTDKQTEKKTYQMKKKRISQFSVGDEEISNNDQNGSNDQNQMTVITRQRSKTLIQQTNQQSNFKQNDIKNEQLLQSNQNNSLNQLTNANTQVDLVKDQLSQFEINVEPKQIQDLINSELISNLQNLSLKDQPQFSIKMEEEIQQQQQQQQQNNNLLSKQLLKTKRTRKNTKKQLKEVSRFNVSPSPENKQHAEEKIFDIKEYASQSTAYSKQIQEFNTEKQFISNLENKTFQKINQSFQEIQQFTNEIKQNSQNEYPFNLVVENKQPEIEGKKIIRNNKQSSQRSKGKKLVNQKETHAGKVSSNFEQSQYLFEQNNQDFLPHNNKNVHQQQDQLNEKAPLKVKQIEKKQNKRTKVIKKDQKNKNEEQHQQQENQKNNVLETDFQEQYHEKEKEQHLKQLKQSSIAINKNVFNSIQLPHTKEKFMNYPSTPSPSNAEINYFNEQEYPGIMRQCQSEDISAYKNCYLQAEQQNIYQFYNQGLFFQQEQQQNTMNSYLLNNNQIQCNQQTNQYQNTNQQPQQFQLNFQSISTQQNNIFQPQQQKYPCQYNDSLTQLQQNQMAERQFYYKQQYHNQYHARTLFEEEGEQQQKQEQQQNYIEHKQALYHNYKNNLNDNHFIPIQDNIIYDDDDKIFEIIGEIKEDQQQNSHLKPQHE